MAYLSEFGVTAEGGTYAVSEGADIRPDENCLLYPGKIKLEIQPLVEYGR